MLTNIQQAAQNGGNIFDMQLRAAFYARVSTDKDAQINSLENQVDFFNEYISKNKNWLFSGSYIDEGISGTGTKNRDSFMLMINHARQNKFDLILTKEISRFSRNTLDSIKYTRELLSYGVGVYFLSDNVNTFLPDAELRLTIMASIAQDEVRRISERVKFGLERAVENGKVLGQDNTYGYKKSNGRLYIDESESYAVMRIFELYTRDDIGLKRLAYKLEGEGIVSKTGKPFSFATLQGIIKNPKYKGFYCGKKYSVNNYRDKKIIRMDKSDWVMYKDESIPAIVTPEIWDTANKILSSRGEKLKEHAKDCQSRYAYSGKIICECHNESYHRSVYKSGKEVWNCRLYRLKGKTNGCDNPTVHSSKIDSILTGIFNEKFNSMDICSELHKLYLQTDNSKNTNRKYERELMGLKMKKDKLLELVLLNLIGNDEFKEKNNKLSNEIKSYETRIKKADVVNVEVSCIYALLNHEIIDRDIISCILEKALVVKKDKAMLRIITKTGEKREVQL